MYLNHIDKHFFFFSLKSVVVFYLYLSADASFFLSLIPLFSSLKTILCLTVTFNLGSKCGTIHPVLSGILHPWFKDEPTHDGQRSIAMYSNFRSAGLP